MGIFDFLGGSGPEKALKLKSKVTQKYGDPSTRQKALQQLGEMKIPEAVSVLLHRYTITVEPLTTDADEKEHVFELIKSFDKDAVAPVTEFLRKNEQATSWALRILESLLPESEVISIVVDTLNTLSAQYMRDPEKKVVLLHYVTGKQDPRIAPAVLPHLDDMADEVKIAALKALGPQKHEPAREPILRLLTAGDTARRVQTAALGALQESGFGVQGYREKVEAVMNEPYYLDGSGLVQRRG
ncbi:HEAT repeat domain-containing protein [Archangium lansingense]|uniref:HEAT repeat domain-containing protein n=1 Tax=Archangium lansingense TaxID=2995310 RepID=A0ABT4ABL6_9BACT|nr:HEAT repeat domain-containing protein [Archangium lansinium]MCY1079065.1 HEAT repeat domain-containing protein [Archangium lansinium]